MGRANRIAVCAWLVCIVSSPAWAVYGVRISDLHRSPLPANPIKIWGKVTSEVPLKISDGKAAVEITGLAARLGDFVVVDGRWDGSVFTVTGTPRAFVGPAYVEMVYVPAGSFSMGNTGSESATYSNEKPQHSVYLSGYWIGKFEVTRKQYKAFVDAGGYTNQAYWSPAGWTWATNYDRTQPKYWSPAQQDLGGGLITQADDCPVTGVTYHEAEAFCNWLGGSLPTEAQWEKAARWDPAAQRPRIYPWGDTWNASFCNGKLDTFCQGVQTASVGSYSSGASYYGCMDMAGNLREWCKDYYGANYYSQPPSGGWVNPQGPDSGTCRVVRGGSFNNDTDQNRCAFRWLNVSPGSALSTDGFRVAR